MTNLDDHYGQDDLVTRILNQLTTSGIDVGALSQADLSGVDEFHLGGGIATAALLADLQLANDARVIDVGCGIGGAARQLAVDSKRHITGIDLTADFIELATELSIRTGLDERTSFEVANATDLAFDDHSFDAATMFHVGMNIENKAALFKELARVVRPGGAIAVYDIMRMSDGDLSFPVPWSAVPSTSHLATPSDYLESMTSAGLTPSAPIDRRVLVRQAFDAANAHPPPANLSHLMGADWPTMLQNLQAALAAGVLAPVQIIAGRNTDASSSK